MEKCHLALLFTLQLLNFHSAFAFIDSPVTY